MRNLLVNGHIQGKEQAMGSSYNKFLAYDKHRRTGKDGQIPLQKLPNWGFAEIQNQKHVLKIQKFDWKNVSPRAVG